MGELTEIVKLVRQVIYKVNNLGGGRQKQVWEKFDSDYSP